MKLRTQYTTSTELEQMINSSSGHCTGLSAVLACRRDRGPGLAERKTGGNLHDKGSCCLNGVLACAHHLQGGLERSFHIVWRRLKCVT